LVPAPVGWESSFSRCRGNFLMDNPNNPNNPHSVHHKCWSFSTVRRSFQSQTMAFCSVCTALS
jgi:hypothetical protein